MQGQAQLPTMAVPKFSVTTEAQPPIMGAARLYCFIRNVRDNKFFASLGCGKVVIAPEHHEIFPPNFSFPIRSSCLPRAQQKKTSLPRCHVRRKTSPTHTRSNP